MKIELKISNDTIWVCATMLRNTYDVEFQKLSDEHKLVTSICYELADKFESKNKAQIKRANLFENKKPHKITLKYHEAWALKKLLMLVNYYPNPNPWQSTIIDSLIAKLDQKLL